MNTLIVGIGECGRNIALQLYYQLTGMRYKYLMKNFDFFITDIEDSLRLIGDIKLKGIPAEVINPKTIDTTIKPLNVFMLSPSSPYAGVGGAWTLASKMAQKFLYQEKGENEKYIDLINLSAKFSECFNIFNSAGGGTGSGAGPIFLEHMRTKSAEDSMRKLFTATIVLPFKNESGNWREVNTATSIARYSKLCDGILIADNEHLKNMIKQDAKTVQKKANELLGNVWMWLSACSSTHLNISPKRWEGADFKRSFKIGTSSAPVVPCYREESIAKLKMINLGWIVLRTIKENCAAECLPQTSNRILVIASLPDKENSSSSESGVADYISNELFKGKKAAIDVIFIRGNMQQVSVTVLLISPKIPRLEELESNFKTYLEDPKLFERDMLGQFLINSQEDILNAYKTEYENFTNYLDYLKKFS